MAKIARKLLAHYINAAPPVEGQPAAEAVYVRLGKDLEEYNPELSAEVESKKNILGESSINISSYEKTGSVEPYIEVKSYGGDTTGYQIPFDLHYTGVKTKGYFDTATKTFKTEAGA